jgi:predicted DNA-binding protein
MATSLGLAPETEQRLDQLASMGSFRSLISSSKIVVVAMKLVRRWA